MFKHTKFQIGMNICHVMFFQCAWIKLHSSSLTNVENLTTNFGQSIQIYFREKEKTKMMAIAQFFALHANAQKTDMLK